MITVTAFRWAPPFAQGLVRDLRVRWALEEAGRPYEMRLIDSEIQASPAYGEQQPFHQVPAFSDGEVTLFESGAIVLHIGAESPALLPTDPQARARAMCWAFAALNSIEVAIQPLAEIDLFHPEKAWARERRPAAEATVLKRLSQLSQWLDGGPYLEDGFTVGDLLMVSVLRILRHTDLVERFPDLAAYRARCEDRPAFQRALAGQMGDFKPPA